MSNRILGITLALATDCGRTDEGRYKIGIGRTFFPYSPTIAFFPTESKNTLHAGFVAAAHALSTVDLFGPLMEGERIGVMVNAAPREADKNGKALRGENRDHDGEDVFAIRLKNGVWVVGPNAGMNFYFIPKQNIAESYVLGGPRLETPFRSLELMVPAKSKVLGVQDFPDITLTERNLVVPVPETGVFVGDWDSHGNIYVVSTQPDESWIPPLGESVTVYVGNECARLRHVQGIFAGHTGEPTLTTGSLRLNGHLVHYIVVVGSDAHGLFKNPPVGTPVRIHR